MKSSNCWLVIAIAVVCFGSCLARAAGGDELAPVGLKKQLLVDDTIIAEKHNLRRVLGKVTKANEGQPVMVADKPWESGRWSLFGFYGTVLHDGEKFRMWYNPWRFAIAYTGFRERHWQFGVPHKSAIGLATLPLDRFVGLQADQKMGTATTRPFKLTGSQLKLNVDAREGSIGVEVLNQAGQPIDQYSAQDFSTLKNVDGLRESVQWKDRRSLADFEGQVVRLRFTLRSATLYALQVQP